MSEPKIVLFDLEVLNDLAEADKHWFNLSNWPGLTIKAQLNSIICFGWKLLGKNNKVNCITAWDYSTWNKNVNDDSELLRDAYKVLVDADCVVTHNGRRFDWPALQTRLLKYGPAVLPKIKNIDTCKVASSNLHLFNNKLDNIGEYLLDDRKMKHEGRKLWTDCRARKPKAMAKMKAYCMQDVLLLEGAFNKLRPFITGLPNSNLFGFMKRPVCSNCGGTRLQSRGQAISNLTRYNRFQCQDCGTWLKQPLNSTIPRTF